MPFLTEARHSGEYIISESEGSRSRDQVTLTANPTVYPAGLVLGQITATGKYVPHAPGASDGSQNAKAILFAPAPISATDTQVTVHARACEVADISLTYAAGITAPQKLAAQTALIAASVVVRASLTPLVNA